MLDTTASVTGTATAKISPKLARITAPVFSWSLNLFKDVTRDVNACIALLVYFYSR